MLQGKESEKQIRFFAFELSQSKNKPKVIETDDTLESVSKTFSSF